MSTATTTVNKKLVQKENMIGETDPKLDRDMREKLITARVGLLLKASFFGNLATRLKLVNADDWCSTAATDGRNFYYNSRFIKMLSAKEVEFLFGHEVLHVVYDHFGRRGDRDPQLWNIANDYAVNADLKKHNVGQFITTVPALYDSKYEGLSSEEIYDLLYENAEKINIEDLLDRIIDEHMDDNKDSTADGEEIDGSGKGRPRLTADEKRKIRDEIKEAVISAVQASDPGQVPAGIKRLVKQITEPKMNWRALLRQQLESSIKNDWSWLRVSRRSWHMDATLPGLKKDEMIDIVVMIDASGSIDEKMLRDFLGEIQGIMDSFPAFKIHVASFDTKIYNAVDYDSDNLDNLCDYEIDGGGGTSFEVIFDYLKNMELEPKQLIVFTDGYPFGSWGDADYCDTLWLIHGTDSIVPPFGQFTYYQK
jgi:predicted metal-dependent peptidase